MREGINLTKHKFLNGPDIPFKYLQNLENVRDKQNMKEKLKEKPRYVFLSIK